MLHGYGSSVLRGIVPLALFAATLAIGSDNASYLVPTAQRIAPAGEIVAFFGRPNDLTLSPDGKTMAIKNSHGIVFVNVAGWRVTQVLPFPKLDVDFAEHLGGGSEAGILWNADGSEVWTTDAFFAIHGARRDADGAYRWRDRSALPAPEGDWPAPIGMTWAASRTLLFVVLNRRNTIAEVDVNSGRIRYEIPVGNAPYGIVRVGKVLYITNWAGRRADGREATADSSGTPIRIDPETGAASSGSVSVVDIGLRRSIAEIDVGLHPSAIVASPDGSRIFVANANSDTVSEIKISDNAVVRTFALNANRVLGRSPGALLATADSLYVAESGSNDVLKMDLATGHVTGRICAGWYPSALALDGVALYIADLKGIGSRADDLGITLPQDTAVFHRGLGGYNAYDWAGIAQKVSARADRGCHDNQWVKAPSDAGRRLRGLFHHVLYIIKENHTYDDYFGDVPNGNGDPRLCMFCAVTPNHHALAQRFGLFDNFYVNSIQSSDGHNWTDEGFASDYVERGLSGWARSYPSAGNDALAYSAAGFIWNRLVSKHLSFRDYGEFIPDVSTFSPPDATWSQIYADYVHGTHTVRWRQRVDIASLRPYVSPDYPSFSMLIPDQCRASVFLRDLRNFERSGKMPTLMIMALGGDHTSFRTVGRPTPKSYAADNDLALGRIVDAVSHSRFWRDTAIFVVEDDAQDGLDHIDGHRTMALVISPYNNRPGKVFHQYYDQASILHTIELIFGLAPLTQFDANAPPIVAPFNAASDLTPYQSIKNRYPLDQLTKVGTHVAAVDRRDQMRDR